MCFLFLQDEDIVCFQDIDPGAPHHYLVIPKKHIHSCLSLQKDDTNLGKMMSFLDVHLIIKLCITVLWTVFVFLASRMYWEVLRSGLFSLLLDWLYIEYHDDINRQYNYNTINQQYHTDDVSVNLFDLKQIF